MFLQQLMMGSPQLTSSGPDPYTISDLIIGVEGDRGITATAGNVDAWADQGTGDADGASDLTPPVNAPAYNTGNALFSGLPTVDFDAANTEYLGSPLFSTPIPQPVTVSMLFSVSDLSARRALHDGESATNRILLRIETSGSFTITSGGDFFQGGSVQLDTVHLVTYVVDGLNSAFYLDDMVTPVSSGDGGSYSLDRVSMGCAGLDGSYPHAGSIYGYFLHGHALTESERETVKTYFQKAGGPT